MKKTLHILGFVTFLLFFIAVIFFGLNFNSFKGDKFVGRTSFFNNPDSSLSSEFHINSEALLLPFSRGYGDLNSWPVAMTFDQNLLKMAVDIKNTEPENFHLLNDKFEKFLFRWAKVEDATAEEVYNHFNRNAYYDPHKVAFLERITGLNFINANKESIAKAKESWDKFFDNFRNRFLVQGTMRKIFPNASYDFAKDHLIINHTLDEVIANTKSIAPENNRGNYYNYVVSIIRLNKSEFNDKDFDKKLNDLLDFANK